MRHIDRVTQMTAELQRKNAQFFEKRYESYNVKPWRDIPTDYSDAMIKVDNFHVGHFVIRQQRWSREVELYVPLNKFPKRLLFVLWVLGFKVRIKK